MTVARCCTHSLSDVAGARSAARAQHARWASGRLLRTGKDGRSVSVGYDPPVRKSDGRSWRLMIARDISERKAAEQGGLAVGELDHRVKNILAVVSRGLADAEDYPHPRGVCRRVDTHQAIARAHVC